MTTNDRWEEVCEAYLAADEWVSATMMLIAELTALGSTSAPTAADWAMLTNARTARDEAESVMVDLMRQREKEGKAPF